MKWLRRKKKPSCELSVGVALPRPLFYPPFKGPTVSAQLLSRVPPQTLGRIFYFVCPHTQDESYESCELSALADTCTLCDLRDLGRCARVCKKWYGTVRNILYYSIRIDRVHYCELEAIFAEKRRQKSFKSRNTDPEDTAQARLRLLCRTLRNDTGGIALIVHFLKIPYMTREISKADLARTISVLPNLRYVDLPDGAFTDDASCETLRLELQARCPDIRKMSYLKGAEMNLERHIDCNIWRNLEVVDLSKLYIDPNILRYALASLPRLRALKVTDMTSFNDRVFTQSDILALFPALVELILEQTPHLTADGLLPYLSRYDTQQTLKTLSLTTTGITPANLPSILSRAGKLENLSINESMSSALPSGVPLLRSNSLRTLRFEVTSSSTDRFNDSTLSHYNYLRSSIMSDGLPNLKELYVLDPTFSETLLDLPLPRPNFAYDVDNFHQKHISHSSLSSLSPTKNRMSTNNPYSPIPRPSSSRMYPANMSPPLTPGFPQALEIYSKGFDEMEWNFNRVSTRVESGRPRRGSAALFTRPTSIYGLSNQTDREWKGAGHDVRRSVIVGNGYGGFLAVPGESDEARRPLTSGSDRIRIRPGSQGNIWK
ncbi:putative f-box domain-containing protein [Erysiphe neolycopersici]|uniref:Putative f-box domain-containing protein n=1 Tax=Erysiphe neolycopersici TaxID=212602 RepID=A0A420HVE4_9PEZI|nr:putative f-box domain-containing protein [Erysiphe neolycopersici]